jgi:hypothetical protein
MSGFTSAATYRGGQLKEPTMSTTLQRIEGRSLVSSELFDRLVHRIVQDDHIGQALAVRIVDQALAFLYACAKAPNTPLRPSRTVDIGWHAFMLHTHAYAEFCDTIAGRFIHHEPDEFEPPTRSRVTLAPTVNTMVMLGLVIDAELWMQGSGACSQCHGGCTDCGQGGGPQ